MRGLKAGLLIVALTGCPSDERLGTELRSFCDLVTEAERLHPEDRVARSAHVSMRSDSALSSQAFVEVMRALAVAPKEKREKILEQAGRRGGHVDFQCPAMIELYQ